MNIHNSIVQGNTANNSPATNDCGNTRGGTYVSQGGNVFGSSTGCPTGVDDIETANAMLGPLQNNGGTTETHALLAGSPAINFITDCDTITADQIGKLRPMHGACDAGAFESDLTGQSFSKEIAAGWNMVGLPYAPENRHYKSVFPNSDDNTFFKFSGSYMPTDSFQVGVGYWLNFPAEDTVSISGANISSVTLNLVAGWNMISGISEDIALVDVVVSSNIINPGTLFGFSGSYMPVDTIRQGEGFWINTNAAGRVTLSAASNSVLGKNGSGESGNRRNGDERLAKSLEDLVDLKRMATLWVSDAVENTQELYYRLPSISGKRQIPPLASPDCCRQLHRQQSLMCALREISASPVVMRSPSVFRHSIIR